jgi:hypothetical protein
MVRESPRLRMAKLAGKFGCGEVRGQPGKQRAGNWIRAAEVAR